MKNHFDTAAEMNYQLLKDTHENKLFDLQNKHNGKFIMIYN